MSNVGRVKELQKQIAGLNESEFQVLYKAMQARQKLTSSSPTTPASGIEHLYSAIGKELQKQLHMKLQPYGGFKKNHPSAKLFVSACADIDQYISLWYPSIDDLRRISLYCLAAELIVKAARRVQKSEVPIWRRVVTQMKNLPALMENSFPGYLGSGLMSKILEKRSQGTSNHDTVRSADRQEVIRNYGRAQRQVSKV